MVALNATSIVRDLVRSPMTQVKLSRKYQIVIPQDVREALELEPGQSMEVMAYDGLVIAVPARLPSECFGMFPDIDTTVERDDEDRL